MGFNRKTTLVGIGIGGALLLWLTGCGDKPQDRLKVSSILYDETPPQSDDSTGLPPGDDDTTPPDNGNTLQPVTALWNLTCDDEVVSQPDSTNIAVDQVISGAGDHETFTSVDRPVVLTLRASPCSDSQVKPRDMLFVVDTSGSMNRNDPLENGTCGRLEALKSVLAGTQNVDARYSIVTFANGVEDTSSNFFVDSTNLFDDIVTASNNGDDIADVICRANGGTNYRAAFARASGLYIMGSRPQAQQEMYVISDGEPDTNEEGIAVADDLKARGIVVGTVMLLGDDQVLENQIASRDVNNLPFHVKVNMAGDLNDAINGLAEDFATSGGKLRYRIDPADPWVELDIPASGQALTAPISLTLDSTPKGLYIEYEYADPFSGQITVVTGHLTLVDDGI